MTAPKNTALETLAIEAESIGDAQGAQPGTQDGEGEAQPAPGPTNAQIIAGAIAMGREVFCTVSKLESPRVHLNDEAAGKLGAAWGPVCEKHGWDLNATIGDWGAEVGAVFVTAQVGLALHAAVKEEIRARQAKPVEAEAETENTERATWQEKPSQ